MFLTPDHLVRELYLKEGDRVADFGSGSGAYTIALAKEVGNTGMVYAVDIHRDMLHTLLGTVERRNLLNVDIVWADIEKHVPLEKYSLDAVVLSNVLFQINDISKVLATINTILKPEGQLLIVEWSGSHGGAGPHEDHLVSESDSEALCMKAGFRMVKRLPAGNYHYAFIACAN
jgi:ubiquinone/menaquinone biosynthesis C-methylase UbiE